LNEDYTKRVLELAQQLESGNDAEAARLLDEITKLRESSLFQELGKLTREFHEAMQTFRLDSRVASIAEKDFPDARERLKYVITMTAQSADRSLTAVEESMPVCTRLEQEAAELHEQWQRFLRRDMDANEFRGLSARVAAYLGSVGDDTGKLKGALNDITMAQDFQDLTGQIIGRVIGLVDDLEASLVELIRISGQNLLPPGKKREKEPKEAGVGAHGPAVPGVDDVAELVSGQDDVDDLLSSLGF
jgi:chemotaxis protein CheZ